MEGNKNQECHANMLPHGPLEVFFFSSDCLVYIKEFLSVRMHYKFVNLEVFKLVGSYICWKGMKNCLVFFMFQYFVCHVVVRSLEVTQLK